MRKFLLAILMAMILSTSLVACNTQPEAKQEIKPQTEPQQKTESSNGLPSRIDLRNYNGKNYVTPAKQQIFGDCWSFAIAGASEISYLYENALGVPAGEVNDAVDFSEKYICWYVYHSITEDDVKQGKIRQSQVGEGYKFNDTESEFSNASYSFGGPQMAGANLFASGFTPVEEKVSVNSEYPYSYKGKNSEVTDVLSQDSLDDDWSIPLNSQYRNPESKAFFRDSFFLPSPALIDENGEYKFNEAGLTAIKTEISKGHGVTLAYYASQNINQRNWATYKLNEIANHAVTIVGYDDNYPKENFAMNNMDGKLIEKTVPPADGAFIAKNSWGKWGEKGTGYFYISYYDQTIVYPVSFKFDKTDSVICKNPTYDQYDMLLSGMFGYLEYDSETKMANVFDAQEDESLYQIAYQTLSPNTSVHYAIYKDIEDGNPESGTLLEEGDNTHEWGGYHRLDLGSKHKLKIGEKYSIVLTMKYTGENGKTHYTDLIPYATGRQQIATPNSIINNGESYLFTDGNWTDLTNLNDTYSKQAYEHNIKENIPVEFKARSVEDIALDNYPIKGISIPEK